MTLSTLSQSLNESILSRSRLLLILEAALESKSFRFARQTALTWLAVYPGDMEVDLILARALLAEGKEAEALAIARKLANLDPVFLAAQELMAQAGALIDPDLSMTAEGCVYALGGEVHPVDVLPEWSHLLHSGWQIAGQAEFEESEKLIHQALALNPDLPLAAVFHLMLTYARKDEATVYRLATLYHERWPECLQFALCLAEAQTVMGDETQAIGLLHHCVASDSTGQVPIRIWGKNYRYRPLWPDCLVVHFDVPIPAEVAGYLGWNQLVSGDSLVAAPPETGDTTPCQPAEPVVTPLATQAAAPATPVEPNVDKPPLCAGAVSVTPGQEPAATVPAEPADTGPANPLGQKSPIRSRRAKNVDQTVKMVEEVFDKFAKKINRPDLAKTDGRFPIYVIFSCRTGLDKKYGAQTTTVIAKELANLADMVNKRANWGSLVFYPDDPACTALLGLSSVEATDPWKLKLALTDLDKSLSHKGERIGAVLIVGGQDVVPFHRLPNPTDDSDKEIYSDNPYSTLDSNYFVPEWPVGRLPGETGQDAGLLLEQVRNLVRYHTTYNQQDSWWRRLFQILNPIRPLMKVANPTTWLSRTVSFGYTASVWKLASMAVYRQVGDPSKILLCPPVASGTLKGDKVTNTMLGYYNLHGVEDSENWYGQKDTNDRGAGPDYPVALSPSNLVKNGHAPQVVFSEACYGGYVVEKNEENSIALKFAGIGTLAVVASTCIAYGSVNTPLIGADLMSSLFWKHLGEGQTVGEAFLQAKVDLSREMNKRQGYLDGEDQKTLISFVLYGDPLVSTGAFMSLSKGTMRYKPHQALVMMSDCQDEKGEPQRLPVEIIREVKQFVAPYLPGMDGATVHINREHTVCDDNGVAYSDVTAKNNPGQKRGRVVVTISKNVETSQYTHHHYARVTLDARGKPIKLVVSR
jgi:hypothetical protein